MHIHTHICRHNGGPLILIYRMVKFISQEKYATSNLSHTLEALDYISKFWALRKLINEVEGEKYASNPSTTLMSEDDGNQEDDGTQDSASRASTSEVEGNIN